jgi:dihydrofolate reductase
MSDYKPLYTIVILFSTLIISCSSGSPFDPGQENITEGSGVIANDDLGMPLRYRHSLELFDDKLWIFAGQAGGHSERDIWYSEDAIEWKKAVDIHDFPPRFSHTSLVYDDKIWIIGGTAVGRFFNDVWSSNDGVNWNEITDNALFGWRNDHSSVVFDNKMWVIGGGVIDQEEHTGEIVNDVWFSTDGENWTQATDSADFQPRLNHESVVFDNKVWVIGGSSSGNYLKDVWYSENGVDWTLATDDIGIGDISSYESIVYNGKIWLIGGTPDGGGVSGEIWYSSDGVNWKKATPFFGRVGHAVTVFQDRIWGVGGASQDSGPSDLNDSWYLNLP